MTPLLDRVVITNPYIFDKRSKLPSDIKSKWLEALRSGTYEQGYTYLKKNGKFCILGVFADLFDKEGFVEDIGITYRGHTTYLSPMTPHIMEVGHNGRFQGFHIRGEESSGDYWNLSLLNDSGFSFIEIADVIEKYF